MKTIALVDAYWSGHHPMVFRSLTKTLLDAGNRVFAFCPDPEGLGQWLSRHAPGYEEYTNIIRFEEGTESWLRFILPQRFWSAIMTWRSVQQAIAEVEKKTGKSPDLVFFAWLDSYLYSGPLSFFLRSFFRYPWAGLYFHPRHLRVKERFSLAKTGFYDHAALLESDRCRSVAVLDEGIVQRLQQRLPGKPVIVFPDVTDRTPPDDNYAIRRQLIEKAKGRKIIGLFGSLDRRKGLLTFLRLAAATVEEDLFYVACGRFHPQFFTPEENACINAMAESDQGNLLFCPQQIPDEACFNALVEVSDLIYAVYEDFYHSSNIITKAALFRKPLVVGKGFCMDERVSRFQLGLSVSCGDLDELRRAIRSLLSGDAGLNPDYEGFLLQHSDGRLMDAMHEVLRSI